MRARIGRLVLAGDARIVARDAQSRQVLAQLARLAGDALPATALRAAGPGASIELEVVPGLDLPAEGYRLRIAADGGSLQAADAHGLAIDAFQTNHEGALVDAIHAARQRCAAIIINPGAFTHYAWSLHDALATFGGPVIEVHISNPNAREAWRHTSVVAPVATGSITGLGMHGYVLAVDAVARLLG